MCGIAGFWFFEPQPGREAVARSMGRALLHRGPDDEGVWHTSAMGQPGWTLVHRRLSIQDVSPAGHQPMQSSGGRYTLVFNGEIYNHLSLRRELEQNTQAPIWRGHSDTETLLAAIQAWGLQASMERATGMFALAVWDAETQTLTLARDRLGEKPLYYGWVGRGSFRSFAFASDLQALRTMPEFVGEISPDALSLYMQFMQVPSPWSIYKNVFKLQAGCSLVIRGMPPSDALNQPPTPDFSSHGLKLHKWWSLAQTIREAKAQPIVDEHQALEELDAALHRSVSAQQIADVPLGSFLSGGIDSTLMSAILQRQSARPIQTFTIGFEETGYNEAPAARAIASYLGVKHHELLMGPRDALHAASAMGRAYSEPFADSSQLPMWLLCSHARQHVTVALSGDGADELFGGYNRHIYGPRVAVLPHALRKTLGCLIGVVPEDWWNAWGARTDRDSGVHRLAEKMRRMRWQLGAGATLPDMHLNWMRTHPQASRWVREAEGELVADQWMAPFVAEGLGLDALDSLLYQDTMQYMCDDVLCKVDRAAMAHSLETRAPYLDADLVRLAWRISPDLKVKGRVGKWVLRRLLAKYVPDQLMDRPKIGFSVPLCQWLKGPLKDAIAEAVLGSQSICAAWIDPKVMAQLWREHQTGSHDHSGALWCLWMLAQWGQDNRIVERS